jgi:hypothetical protein
VPFIRNRINPEHLNGFVKDFKEPNSPRATFPVMNTRNSNGSISRREEDPNLPNRAINEKDYNEYLSYNKKGILSKYPAKKL